MTAFHLTLAALVCGMMAIGACFLAWSVPERSLADLQAEAFRAQADGDLSGPGTLVEETRRAYQSAGTKPPFHGRWVIALCVLGILVAGSGSLLLTLEARFGQPAERVLRLAGILFALAGVLVLLDGSPGNFPFATRGQGWWLAWLCSLVACFCATFGSTRIPAIGSDADASAAAATE